MPTIGATQLVSNLTARVQSSLDAADANRDGAVDASERTSLPADVRGLADNTADAYLSGGPLPIDAYVNAYRSFAEDGVRAADANGTGRLTDGEQQNLSAPLYSSLIALRSQQATPAPAATGLDALYQQLGNGGWTDDKIMQFIDTAWQQGELNSRVTDVYNAVLNPKLPANAHAGDRFYEALAWYVDKTIVRSGDGQITRAEIQSAAQAKAQEYLGLVGQPGADDARRQAWKMVEKLGLLERELDQTGLGAFPYDAGRLSRVNSSSAWNQANTIDSVAEFQRDVIDASYDKPVLVKYGLPYCVHCLLIEHLDSVKAAADKYGADLDVKKVWWNPSDPSLAEPTAVANAEGVTSSPYFIVYKDGEAVSKGYAFPDEHGNGLEDLLQGVL